MPRGKSKSAPDTGTSIFQYEHPENVLLLPSCRDNARSDHRSPDDDTPED